MDIQHLCHTLKVKWLLYYRQNRPWLVRLRIWGTFDGQRRPSSSFILAVLSTLEPELTQILPFIVDLNNHPDQILVALGLNFNPDTELKLISQAKSGEINGDGLAATLLPAESCEEDLATANQINISSYSTEWQQDQVMQPVRQPFH